MYKLSHVVTIGGHAVRQVSGIQGRVVRTTLVSALVLVAVAAGQATAATSRSVTRRTAAKPAAKPAATKVCDLVKATAKDQNSTDPNLHVISADVATSGNLLTSVIRVQHLTEGIDTSSPGGLTWMFSFQVGVTRPVDLSVSYSPVFGAFDPNGMATKITLDTATNSIYYTTTLQAIASQVGVTIVEGQTVLRNLLVQTYSNDTPVTPREAGGQVIGNSVAVPIAGANIPSTATYLAGTPSCVQVGY